MLHGFHCAGCGLWHDFGTVTVTHSGLFGATPEMQLCPPCAKAEEELMDSTNHQPERLEQYRQMLAADRRPGHDIT
jgi:hypothetical protein